MWRFLHKSLNIYRDINHHIHEIAPSVKISSYGRQKNTLSQKTEIRIFVLKYKDMIQNKLFDILIKYESQLITYE